MFLSCLGRLLGWVGGYSTDLALFDRNRKITYRTHLILTETPVHPDSAVYTYGLSSEINDSVLFG